MKRQHIITAICVLALIWAIPRLFRGRGGDAGLGSTIHEVVAQVLAEQTAKLVDGEGQIVMLVPGPDGLVLPTADAFYEAASRVKGLDIEGEELFSEDSDPLEGFGSLGATAFAAIAEKHPDADAFVSIEGVPGFEDLDQWPDVPAKLIVCTLRLDRDSVLDVMDVVDLAIVPQAKTGQPGEELKKGQTQEIFDRFFELLRHE